MYILEDVVTREMISMNESQEERRERTKRLLHDASCDNCIYRFKAPHYWNCSFYRDRPMKNLCINWSLQR